MAAEIPKDPHLAIRAALLVAASAYEQTPGDHLDRLLAACELYRQHTPHLGAPAGKPAGILSRLNPFAR